MNRTPSNEFMWGNFLDSQLELALEISSLVYGYGEGKKLPGNPVLSIEYFRNKHLNSPSGESIYIRKFEDDVVVGHIFLQKREFLKCGKPFLSFYASDLVSKSNRPLGGVQLFKKAKSISEEFSSPFINLSNNDSKNIYERFLKMRPKIELDFRVAPLNLNFTNFAQIKRVFDFGSEFVRRIANQLIGDIYQFSTIDEFNEELDRFLDANIGESELIGRRNSRIINWRFNATNQKDYFRVQVTSKKEVIGYFVFTTTNFFGKEIVVLVDFFVNRPSIRLGLALLNYAAHVFPSANLFLVPCNMNSEIAKRTFGFSTFRVPGRLIPQRIPLYVTDSNSILSGALMRSHLTLFDTDIF